jgi:amino acid transporter
MNKIVKQVIAALLILQIVVLGSRDKILIMYSTYTISIIIIIYSLVILYLLFKRPKNENFKKDFFKHILLIILGVSITLIYQFYFG